jgi:hypothetical protein
MQANLHAITMSFVLLTLPSTFGEVWNVRKHCLDHAVIAFACALIIAIDEFRHSQKMWIMNIVWPLTALCFSAFALWGYFRAGRKMSRTEVSDVSEEERRLRMEQARRDPTFIQTAIADSHCAAGCVLGDLIEEYGLFVLAWSLFGRTLYAEYAGDLLLAWLFGIAFQHFTIKPMRNLSAVEGLKAALKSDTLAIITLEIGLFAWMGLMYFVVFPYPHLKPTEAAYWSMTQIGMVMGFLTSYPMNRWLIKIEWKAVMG